MRDFSPRSAESRPQVCLRQGVSEKPCECLRFEPQGVIFQSARPFELMCSLMVNFEWDAAEHCGRRMALEGVVIDCRETGPARFETTVFFEYLPVGGNLAVCGMPQVLN